MSCGSTNHAHIFHQSLPIKSVIILCNPNIANLLPVVTCLLKDGTFLHLNKHHIILLFSWIVLKKKIYLIIHLKVIRSQLLLTKRLFDTPLLPPSSFFPPSTAQAMRLNTAADEYGRCGTELRSSAATQDRSTAVSSPVIWAEGKVNLHNSEKILQSHR